MVRNSYAFDDLVVSIRDRLMAQAVKLTQDRSAADDIVQDAMVRAMRAWPRWTPSDPSDPAKSAAKWMQTIVGNCFLNYTTSYYYKTNKRLGYTLAVTYTLKDGSNVNFHDMSNDGFDNRLNHRHVLHDEECVTQPAQREEFCDFVEHAVQRLPAEWQQILRMYASGMTQMEIAKALSTPEVSVKVSTVSTRLVRAFDRIRPLLATYASSQGHSAASAWQQANRREATQVMQADPDRVHSVV